MTSVQRNAPGPTGLVPIVHADDCGLSAGITDAILACHDNGALCRTSIVANGAGWVHAVAALRQRPLLSVALHLNLFEGSPLSPPGDVALLVNDRGRFHRSFAGLLAHGLAGTGTTRLRVQIRLELRRQLDRFLEAFEDRGPLTIDAHVHYHVLPLVFDELMALCDDYPIATIRLPREPVYWPFTPGAPRPPLANIAKNLVLRALSRRAGPVLHARAVKTTAAFVGVLGTGEMSLAHVGAALACLRRSGTTGTIEILFHPGRARPDEASLWSDRPELQAFYLSADRDREAAILCSPRLRQLLDPAGSPALSGHLEAPV